MLSLRNDYSRLSTTFNTDFFLPLPFKTVNLSGYFGFEIYLASNAWLQPQDICNLPWLKPTWLKPQKEFTVNCGLNLNCIYKAAAIFFRLFLKPLKRYYGRACIVKAEHYFLFKVDRTAFSTPVPKMEILYCEELHTLGGKLSSTGMWVINAFIIFIFLMGSNFQENFLVGKHKQFWLSSCLPQKLLSILLSSLQVESEIGKCLKDGQPGNWHFNLLDGKLNFPLKTKNFL